jgi:hypothetical protein
MFALRLFIISYQSNGSFIHVKWLPIFNFYFKLKDSNTLEWMCVFKNNALYDKIYSIIDTQLFFNVAIFSFKISQNF